MKNLLLSIFLLIIAVINSGCPKPCVEAKFSFAVSSQIKPALDSIKRGDTIYLISSFPTTLMDLTTGKPVNYTNSTGIGSNIYISKFDETDLSTKDAVFDFDYFSIKGQIYNDRNIPRPDGVQQLLYKQSNENYELKVGLIPKEVGNYVLSLGNGLSTGISGNRNCEKASFDISLSNTNQHFYLLKLWRPDLSLDEFGMKHVYYFKVY